MAKARAKSSKSKKRPVRNARNSDRHELYQLSVQAPDVDAPILARYFKRYVGREAESLREDFCGTAFFAAYWVKMKRSHRAVGVDLDGPTLEWGRRHNLAGLTDEQRSRIVLHQSDVRTVQAEPTDIVTAFNFSYSLLMTRKDLGSYFAAVRKSMKKGGLFFIDAWGGSETIEDREEERKVEDFTYVWDQHDYEPISGCSECRIHFRFKDGSEKRNAFTYRWRQWNLPELIELLGEAGFADVHVLWEGTDKATNEGNGVYRRVKRGEADPSWICYVVGQAR
ncbi:MAG: class I SAM-dependent methyltransferase [Planctomycetota bacterium]